MDVLAFAGGFLAGLLLPSLLLAACIAAGLELAVTGYQYFFTEPRVWGNDLPAEFIGLAVFVVLAIACAGLGHAARRYWMRPGRSAVS